METRRTTRWNKMSAGTVGKGGWVDGFLFLMLSCWKAMSPAYVVTDANVDTTSTHADRSVMSGHKNLIWSLANNCADSLSLIWEKSLICLQSEQSLRVYSHVSMVKYWCLVGIMFSILPFQFNVFTFSLTFLIGIKHKVQLKPMQCHLCCRYLLIKQTNGHIFWLDTSKV